MDVRAKALVRFAGAGAAGAILGAAVFAGAGLAEARPQAGTLSYRVTHSQKARPPIDNKDHLYVLDGWGGVHPVGASPLLEATASWPMRHLAYSLALFPEGDGGYVLDGTGGLHPVGDAPPLDSGVSWPNWMGAREVVMAPWSSRTVPAGYILDADGGVHAFGGAPEVAGFPLWRGQAFVRGMALTRDSSPDGIGGYTLDAAGGVHAFGGAPPIALAALWPGQDVARGLVLLDGRPDAGYVLDLHGFLHPFGGAPPVNASTTWPGLDMADSVTGWTYAPAGLPGGWVLDRHGVVHPYGSAPDLAVSASWPSWDAARSLAGAGGSGGGGGSLEKLILDPVSLRDGWGAYFNQRDGRWAAAGVGSAGSHIWKIGCLVADLAMVYSHFGFAAVTPASVASQPGWFDARGDMLNGALAIPDTPPR